jgi:hypothetical protein
MKEMLLNLLLCSQPKMPVYKTRHQQALRLLAGSFLRRGAGETAADLKHCYWLILRIIVGAIGLFAIGE